MKYKCTNFGGCSKADNKELIELPPGSDQTCPECPAKLYPVPSTSGPNPVPMVAGLIGLVVIAALIWGFTSLKHNHATPQLTEQGSQSHSNGGGTPPPPPPATPAEAFAIDAVDPTTVTNFGVPLITEVVSYGSNSPKVRAQRIASRLNDCYDNDLIPPRTVLNCRQGFIKGDASGTKYVFFGYLHEGDRHDTADIIATIDKSTAAHCHVSPTALACWWRDILRDWLLIDHGQQPQYTVQYTPELKDFFNAIPAGDRADQPQRYQKAVDTLINSNDEYERLRLLSLTVPPNYVVTPDNYTPSLADDGGPNTSG